MGNFLKYHRHQYRPTLLNLAPFYGQSICIKDRSEARPLAPAPAPAVAAIRQGWGSGAGDSPPTPPPLMRILYPPVKLNWKCSSYGQVLQNSFEIYFQSLNQNWIYSLKEKEKVYSRSKYVCPSLTTHCVTLELAGFGSAKLQKINGFNPTS